jgi:flagellar hook-associated protein 2
MSSTITGVGSGFDIDGWVSQLVAIKQSSTVTPLEEKLSILNTQNTAVSSLKSKYTALQSSLQAFTNIIYDSTSDMWTNTTINSSNSTYATATSTGTVGASLVELEVEQVATATVAKSAFALGSISKENIENTRFTDLANGQAKEDVFSMFLNGKVYDIEIKSDDTLKQVLDNISDETDGKVKATVGLDGKISIQAYKEVEKTTQAKMSKYQALLGGFGGGLF